MPVKALPRTHTFQELQFVGQRTCHVLCALNYISGFCAPLILTVYMKMYTLKCLKDYPITASEAVNVVRPHSLMASASQRRDENIRIHLPATHSQKKRC